jgi:hypothetical protein
VSAQSISYAPTSLDIWGETKYTSVYSFEYAAFGMHYFNIRKTYVDELGAQTVDEAFAVSFLPIDVENILKLGVIVYDKPFPTDNGQRINLWIEAGINFYMFRLSYVHISNAYTGRLNHGIDFINLTLRL